MIPSIKLSSREKHAIFSALLLLVAGIAVSYWQCEPAWVSRFGALIIIVGVYFAYSDLPAEFERSARAMIKLRTELAITDAITTLEDEDHILLNQEQKDLIRKHFTPSSAEIERDAKRQKNRFAFVEVVIICVGTFANGLGQWVLEKIW